MRVVLNSNNIIRVLKAIWLKPGISRIEISKQLSLDKIYSDHCRQPPFGAWLYRGDVHDP